MTDIKNYNGFYIVWENEIPHYYFSITDIQELTTELTVTLYDTEQEWLDELAKYDIDPYAPPTPNTEE